MGGRAGLLVRGERYDAAIARIYAAASAPATWPIALQAIADCFDDIGAVLFYRRDDGSFGAIVSARLEAAQAEYNSEWWRHDIRATRGIEYGYRSHSNAITDRHVVTSEEVETHPFYTQFLARHGLKWVAGTDVSPDVHCSVAISVQRVVAKRPFTDEEVDLLAKIGRHAEQSLRLSIRLIDAEVASLSLGDALARLSIGVFLLDGLRRIVFSNPYAEHVLGDGLMVTGMKLAAQFASDRAALDAEIAAKTANDTEAAERDPRPIVIQRMRAERPLIVYVLPVRPSENPLIDNFLARSRAIVLVIDPQPGEPADPAAVRDLLGLTMGEARVAALVGSGLPPRSAAEKLGISEETARTALKRVFLKVGVSRQSELSALLTKLVLH